MSSSVILGERGVLVTCPTGEWLAARKKNRETAQYLNDRSKEIVSLTHLGLIEPEDMVRREIDLLREWFAWIERTHPNTIRGVDLCGEKGLSEKNI